MFLSALQCAFRRTLAFVLAGTLTAMSWAQTATQPAAALPDGPRPQRLAVTDYSKPNSHFPNPLAPYMARHLPPADLLNTPRIEQLLRDGKLYLSMNDAVALALENNLDIAISRYNLNIADTDVLRANAGANTLGVSLGLLQGTPGGNAGGLGGTIGSGPGGTSVSGTAGAGGGASGLVISTLGAGPQITSFDPDAYRFVAVRSQQYFVLQYLCPTQHHPKFHHCGFFLFAGLQVGLEPPGGIQ